MVTGQLSLEGQHPQYPQVFGMLGHSPEISFSFFLSLFQSTTILTMWTVPFWLSRSFSGKILVYLEKIRNHLLPSISKKKISSLSKSRKQNSLAARHQPPHTWALLVLVACIITRHWIQVIPIHVTTGQSILWPEERERKETDGH